MSQLVRLGMVTLLQRTGFRITVREVADPGKLLQAIPKDQARFLIIGRSFLNACNKAMVTTLRSKFHTETMMLMVDTDLELHPEVDFIEVIERTDTEKVMLRKLEKHLVVLSGKNTDNPHDEISDRERDVLRLVAQGFTNKEIADRLFISSHTVITHRKNITAKLGIKTIAGLTMYALINQIIIPEETKQ